MNLEGLNLDALRPILPIPMWQKAVALTAAFVLIIVLYIYFGWVPLQDKIDQQQSQVEVQQMVLKKNQMLARNLPKKKAEFAELEKQLKVALNMLPKKSQIPDLLESVSWAGKDSGLEFTVFTPNPEVVKQIYAEVPVSLTVTGSYRQFLTFLKRVGEMPRIVAVKNIKISSGQDDELSVAGNIMTYRFVDENKAKANRSKRRR
ncbi:type 4a pilus biogenesis protein PilO [Pseudomonadota bacterium]